MSDRGRRAAFALSLLFSTLVFVTPFYWMLKTSVEPAAAIFEPPMRLWPKGYSLEHYRRLLGETEFLTYFKNSVIVALGAVVMTVACSVPGGYALARFELPGKRTLARFALLSYMFPPLMLGVPFFLLFTALRLRNTYAGLIIAHSVLVLPFGLWLMWQFFQTVPRSYEESAWVSGASRFRTFLEVAVPLASPGIVTIAVLSFALSWSDFEFAFVLITDSAMETLPLGVYRFVTGYVHWGLTQAAAVLIAIPAFLVVLFLQGYLVRGLGAGGLK
jgi:multiple sugar transport system permease protein